MYGANISGLFDYYPIFFFLSMKYQTLYTQTYAFSVKHANACHHKCVNCGNTSRTHPTRSQGSMASKCVIRPFLVLDGPSSNFQITSAKAVILQLPNPVIIILLAFVHFHIAVVASPPATTSAKMDDSNRLALVSLYSTGRTVSRK